MTKKTYQSTGWNLSELLPDTSDSVISERLSELENNVQKFVTRREELNPEMEPQTLIELVQNYAEITEQAYKLGAYGGLWFSADTQSNAALNYQNRMQQTLTDMQNRMLFFDIWWKSLNDDEAAALLPNAQKFPDYRHYLEDLRRTKPHTLDEKSEQLINTKDGNGISAIITLYSMLTNRLEFTLDVDGEKKTLTRDALSSYVQGINPDLRVAAYQELYRVYEKEAKILAQIYSNRVRDWYNEQVTLRGYTSPISVRNVANDIPDVAVETLLNVARKNVGVFQRYFKLKAGWLGMEKLRRYDVYAPLTKIRPGLRLW